MCLLNENVSTKRNLLKCYNPLYQMSIDWKCAYWPKKCQLNENVPIDRKDVYWQKMCILNENVSIDWKCVYPIKMYLLIENVLTKWKCANWSKYAYKMKMCLLIEKVPIENEKLQMFSVFTCICGINLCSHVVQ